MKNLVDSFSTQITEAVKIGETFKYNSSSAPIHNVLISGLGGSGIGGTLAAELVEKEATVPILVNKKYHIGKYVNEHTLFIASSYSGNTEETIEALNMAISRGAKIVCVSSGGAVIDIAKQHGLDLIILPGGMPPRACLGYSLTQLFYILNGAGIIANSFKNSLHAFVDNITKNKATIQQEAMEVAKFLHGKLPVLYTLSYEGVAVRFRQQINENSKELCWHQVVPEMNHNELVGWRTKDERLAVIIFRNESDYIRNKKRMEVCESVIREYTPNIRYIDSKGSSDLECALYHIHLTDWASCYLAELKNIDPTEVNVITRLKGELSKF